MPGEIVDVRAKFPSAVVRECSGLAIDIGGSAVKIFYRSKEDYEAVARDETAEFGTLHYLTCGRPDLGTALERLRDKVHLLPGGKVYSTGLGGLQFRSQLKAAFQTEIENVMEGDCLVEGLKYSMAHIPERELIHPDLVDVTNETLAEIKLRNELHAKIYGGAKNQFFKTDFEMGVAQAHELDSEKSLVERYGDELYPFLVVHLGSNHGWMKFEKDAPPKFCETTLRGGRSFLGVASLLTGARSYAEFMELAAKGDNLAVDQSIRSLGKRNEGTSAKGSNEEGTSAKGIANDGTSDKGTKEKETSKDETSGKKTTDKETSKEGATAKEASKEDTPTPTPQPQDPYAALQAFQSTQVAYSFGRAASVTLGGSQATQGTTQGQVQGQHQEGDQGKDQGEGQGEGQGEDQGEGQEANKVKDQGKDQGEDQGKGQEGSSTTQGRTQPTNHPPQGRFRREDLARAWLEHHLGDVAATTHRVLATHGPVRLVAVTGGLLGGRGDLGRRCLTRALLRHDAMMVSAYGRALLIGGAEEEGGRGQEAKEPGGKERGAKNPAAKEPGAKEPETKKPEAKEPEAKEPEAKEPGAKEPGAKEPGAKEPGIMPPPRLIFLKHGEQLCATGAMLNSVRRFSKHRE